MSLELLSPLLIAPPFVLETGLLGDLAHSPADILRWLLVGLGTLSDPTLASAWPGFVSSEPDSPDDCITLYDTQGQDDGRVGPTQQRYEHHGVQVRVRARSHAVGYQKARTLAITLDQQTTGGVVVIGGNSYHVYSVTRTAPVSNLGSDQPGSRRFLFTLNALISLRPL